MADTELIVRIRPGPRDVNGDRGPPVVADLEFYALYAPGASNETSGQTNTVDTIGQVYLEGEPADVRPGDQLRIRGVVFEAIGQPAVWAGFGQVITVRKVTG